MCMWLIETGLCELFQSAVIFSLVPPYTIYESNYMRQNRERNVKVCRHAVNTSTHMESAEIYPRYSCLLSELVLGKGFSRGARGRVTRISWLTDPEPLLGERGLAEVQKQRQSQMETLEKQRRITSDNIRKTHEIDRSVC